VPPERIGDLEVVALMSDDVDERLVTGVAEVAFSGVGTNRLAALAMQVAPIAPQRCAGRDTQWIGAGQFFASLGVAEAQSTSPGSATVRSPKTRGPSCEPGATLAGRFSIGRDGARASGRLIRVGLPHRSSATTARRNHSPAATSEAESPSSARQGRARAQSRVKAESRQTYRLQRHRR
jgi:hypothetical protein